MERLIIICFYFPLIFRVLNLQAFLAKFTPAPASLVQLFAYFNVVTVIIGAIFLLNRKNKFSKAINFWIFFYAAYYSLSLLANAYHGTLPHRLLPSLIAPAFFLGFAVLLSIPEQRIKVAKVLTISFFCTCILNIVFDFYNISLDFDGIYQFELNRAGGVYGDANNAAVSSILSFIFIKYIFHPQNKIQQIIKFLGLIISVYSIILTFSKTGFVILAIILVFAYPKLFNVRWMFLSILILPVLIILSYSFLISSDILNSEQLSRVENVVNLITLQTDKVNFSGRDTLLKNMFGFIEQNPVIGNGIGFSELIRGHNTIIGVWADAGIFTFLLFLFLLIYFFKESLFSKAHVRFFSLSILITLSVYMLTLQTIINQAYLMVVFALLGFMIEDNSNFNTFLLPKSKFKNINENRLPNQ